MMLFRKLSLMRAERWGLRPVVVIVVMLAAGILIKLGQARLGTFVAAALCLLLAGMRRGPQ
jgi:uncharacterized membrane protein (DUF4010 family)